MFFIAYKKTQPSAQRRVRKVLKETHTHTHTHIYVVVVNFLLQ